MRIMILTFSCILLLIIIGCSKGANEPIAPSSTPSLTQIQGGPIGVGVSDYFADGSPAGGYGVLGLYNAWVDTQTLKGEIVPARQSSLTDVLEALDITNFCTLAPCTDCVKMMTIKLNGFGDLQIEIGIKHPFPAGDPLKPITGRNRADLHVFNIEGTVVTDGMTGWLTNFPGLAEKVGNLALKNADGFTPYLDKSLDTVLPTYATIHPYKLHFRDYSSGNFDPMNPTGFSNVTTPGPSGNLVMKMGSNYDVKDYVFDTSRSGYFEFTFAVGCTYAVSSAKRADRFNPEYRIPQDNKKAASEVSVEVVTDDLVQGDTSSTAVLAVDVLDISHGVPVGTGLNEMLADSSVKSISVEIPWITATPLVVDTPVPVSGNGRDPADPLRFEITVTNTAGGSDGTYRGLVKVVDSYTPGLNTSPSLDGKDGIARVPPGTLATTATFDITEFATYQIFQIGVVPAVPNCFLTTVPDPPIGIQGDPITFDGTNSYGHAPITTYEWDMNYDGTNFDVDETGVIITVNSCKIGTRDVALRVTDERFKWSICTVPITINADSDPIGPFHTDKYIGGTIQGAESDSMGFRAVHTYKDDVYVVFWDWGYAYSRPCDAWFIRSEDKGLTWAPEVNITQYPTSITSSNMWVDPTIWVDDKNGDIYVTYCSNIPSQLASAGYGSDIYIRRSSDRGYTWGPEIKVNDEPYSSSSSEEWHSMTVDDSADPSYIYVTYTSSANRDIHFGTTTADNFLTWTITYVDDPGTSNGALQSCITVHPIDKSVMVSWGDSKSYGGNGSVMFDRSIDHGATWGTDVVVNNDPAEAYGAYNTIVAVNSTTGIPGIMWRQCYSATWQHMFVKANSADGATWGTPIQIDTGPSFDNWSGSLAASQDGHWVACTMNLHRVWFTQSQDDGLTWTAGESISDSGSNHFNPNITFDECKNFYVAWTVSGTPGVWFDWGT